MHGEPTLIARVFGALVELQPIQWQPQGLVCLPGLVGDGAAAARAACPLPLSATVAPTVVPDSLARLVAGWYRRTDLHAPAPPRVRELVQVAGEGFGPADHPTTTMCLAGLGDLPDGEALDVGCGSGLLAQAWVALGRGPARGVDADPAAVMQATGSAIAAGHGQRASFTVGRIEALHDDELTRSVLLANLPPPAHHALIGRVRRAPRAAIISGTTRSQAEPILAHYRALGLRRVRTLVDGRWVCTVLVPR